ncbi:MAG: hypothetical protein NT011_13465 [Kiritimatiellaeota bacterium]|nr:hypothetical protein [Kiritimatiellota bacterium]
MKKVLFLFVLFAIFAVKSFAALEIENAGVSNITRISATYYGTLVSTNGSGTNPAVTLYYGTSDAGTNTTNWVYSCIFSNVAVGSFFTNLTGLTPAKYYYCRPLATEGASNAWAAASTSFWTTAGGPTGSYPAATGGVLQVISTNGEWLAPTKAKVIAANDLATGSQVSNSTAAWATYPATTDVNIGTKAIILGGYSRTNWPDHGTNDLSMWSLYPALYDINAGTQSVILGGVARTNWPVDATDVAASNAALGIRVVALEVGVSNVSQVVTGLVDYSTNYATRAWLAAQSYVNSNNYTFMLPFLDSRYSALGHLHSGVYSPTNHSHTGIYSPVSHLHETNYLHVPSVPTNMTTNSVMFYDGTNADGTVKTRMGFPWSGTVSNWMTIGLATQEVVVPKLSIGSNVLTRPELLNIWGVDKARAQFSIVGGIMTSNQVATTAGSFVQLTNSYAATYPNVYWQTGAASNNLSDICSNGSYAHVLYTSAEAATESSRTLRVGNWNFSIPLSATIVGLKVNLSVRFYDRLGEVDCRIWNNGFLGITYSAEIPPDVWTISEWGGTNSLLGLNSLSPVEVNSSDFSVDIRTWLPDGHNAGSGIQGVQGLNLTVYYTLDEYPWTLGVDSDASFSLKNERTGDVAQKWDTNSITLYKPLAVPQITLGTNPPTSTWPAGGTSSDVYTKAESDSRYADTGTVAAVSSNLAVAINTVSQRVDVAEGAIITNAAGIATNAVNINTLSQRVDVAESAVTSNAAGIATNAAAINVLSNRVTGIESNYLVKATNAPISGYALYAEISGSTTSFYWGSVSAANGLTNQIMDAAGVLYTITNAPAAINDVLKFNSANSTAWFAAESGGGTGSGFPLTNDVDLAGYKMSDGVFRWNEVVTNIYVGGPTNLLVTGWLTPDATGMYTQRADVAGMPSYHNANGYDIYRIWQVEMYYYYLGTDTNGSCLFVTIQDNPTSANWTPNGTVGTPTVVYFYGTLTNIVTNTWQLGLDAGSGCMQKTRNGMLIQSWYANSNVASGVSYASDYIGSWYGLGTNAFYPYGNPSGFVDHTVTNDLSVRVDGLVSGAGLGATALQPAGSGSGLSGITAAQVGAYPNASGVAASNLAYSAGTNAAAALPASWTNTPVLPSLRVTGGSPTVGMTFACTNIDGSGTWGYQTSIWFKVGLVARYYPTNAFASTPYNLMLNDSASGYNTNTYKYTIPVAGQWNIGYSIYWPLSGTAGGGYKIMRGTTGATNPVSFFYHTTQFEYICIPISFSAGDTVWMQTYIDNNYGPIESGTNGCLFFGTFTGK